MKGFEKQILETLAACEAVKDKPNASSYLPDVIESLHEMARIVSTGGESMSKRRRRTAGLFRIVSDDVRLLNSTLGERLVILMNEYPAWTPMAELEREYLAKALADSKGKHSVAVRLKKHSLFDRLKAAAKSAGHSR